MQSWLMVYDYWTSVIGVEDTRLLLFTIGRKHAPNCVMQVGQKIKETPEKRYYI